ncbi:MAG: UDP-glucose--hexose-1-phosphate uridylyltransferase, partial [Fusobacteriaceae bacterium]
VWRNYSDESIGLFSKSDDVPHNTITPIARKKGEFYEIDLVFRNNKTSEEHPLGIFHPHSEVHHIKKENIGLIEVMGLAVLPGRLKDEIKSLVKALGEKNAIQMISEDKNLKKHLYWIKEIVTKKPEIINANEIIKEQILRDEIGIRFSQVLEHAGVFKRDEIGKKAFIKFLDTI